MPSWSRRLSNFAAKAAATPFRTLTRGASSGSLSDDLVGSEHSAGDGAQRGILAMHKRPGSFHHERTGSKDSIWSVSSTSVDETADQLLINKLFEAVKVGNIAELNSMLQSNPELIHVKTATGQSPLHVAALTADIRLIDFLVEKHAELDARDRDGNTPLHVAVMNGDKNVVAALLVLKADPNLKNNILNTPIHVAARQGKTEILQTLLDYNCTDINTPGQNGETALHVAASLNNVDCLNVLVRHRASVCRPSYNGLRPIHMAASRGSMDVLRYLLTEGNVGYTINQLLTVTDDEQGTPLHAAVYAGQKEAVDILLKNGASITAQTRDLTTPLHLACSLGVLDIVREICEVCSPDVVEHVLAMKDEQGMTPLHRAVMFGHWKLIMILMNKGANIDETDSDGRTSLVLAASRSAREAVSELLMLGADTSIRDNEGRNFLHFIVLTGGDQEAFHNDLGDDTMFCRLLNDKDKHGCTPLHYAAQGGFGNCSELLLRLGASLTSKNTQARSPLHYAAEYGRYNTVKKLLQTPQGSGVINDTDREGCTALHLASRNGHAKVVQLLLTNGALTHKYIEGGTSLHAAVINDHLDTAELLVEHYSYLIDIMDKFGNTALHLAAKHNARRCAEFLLSKGATLSVNKEHFSAMDMAIANRSQDVALVMVEHARWKEILSQPSSIYGWVTQGLIKELPAVMKTVLDQCITVSDCHPLSKEYYEKYDYHALQLDLHSDFYRSGTHKKTQPLEALNHMVAFKRYDLIAHPVCKSYLNSKWMSYGIYFHFSNLLIYGAFLGMLTSLILRGVEIDLKPHMTDLSLRHLFANKPNTSRQNLSYFGLLPVQPGITAESLPNVDVVFLYIILIFTATHLLKKLLQISIQGKRYFFRLVNYFELVCYLTALVFSISFLDERDKYVPWRVQWGFGAVAIFCAWFNLILHMQRYGKPGIYVGIFLREMRVLMKAASVYFIMVVAFSIAFCVLNPEKIFPDTDNFYQVDHGDDSPNDWQTAHKTLQSSIMRISDMLVGDVDAIQNYIDPMLNDQLMFPDATYFLALVTVGVITLLIQAILMGTAVYDLEKIEKSATINILAMQVALHTDLESKLPAAFLNKVQKTEAVVYPNYTKWRVLTKWFDIFTTGDLEGLTGKNIRRGDRQRKASRLSDSNNCGAMPGRSVPREHSRLKDVSGKMDQLYEMLRMVVQRVDIKVDTDVVDDPSVARRRISRYAVRQSSRPPTAWKTSVNTAQTALKSAIKQRKQSGRKSATFGSFGVIDSDSSSSLDRDKVLDD